MKILDIAENDSGQRLDKFLRKLFPQATRALLYKINRTGKVKISSDGVTFWKQDNEYKLQKGQKVKLFLSDNDFTTLSEWESPSQKIPLVNKFDKKDIVYEDAYLLVVNKSAGVTVHPWDHKSTESSLIEQVHDYFGGKMDSLTFKPSLVHRIDRDTSWIVLVAKKKDILTRLVNDLKEHSKVKKTYFALVDGILEKKSWTIEAKLERLEDAKNQNKVRVSADWQRAISHYKVLFEGSYQVEEKKNSYSFVEIEIETGRMHQIRVHMAHIWHPILWDNTYGNKSLNYILSKKFFLTRQMLHAWKITFFHYGQHKELHLEARLKKDMREAIFALGGKSFLEEKESEKK